MKSAMRLHESLAFRNDILGSGAANCLAVDNNLDDASGWHVASSTHLVYCALRKRRDFANHVLQVEEMNPDEI